MKVQAEGLKNTDVACTNPTRQAAEFPGSGQQLSNSRQQWQGKPFPPGIRTIGNQNLDGDVRLSPLAQVHSAK